MQVKQADKCVVAGTRARQGTYGGRLRRLERQMAARTSATDARVMLVVEGSGGEAKAAKHSSGEE